MLGVKGRGEGWDRCPDTIIYTFNFLLSHDDKKDKKPCNRQVDTSYMLYTGHLHLILSFI